MITTKIHAMLDTFSPTEQKIALYINSNKKDVRIMTSYELAEILGIGQSNIIRFSQKLGYKGFRDLQMNIDVVEEPENKEIKESDTTEVVNSKIVQQYINITKLTNNSNPPELIDRCVNRIVHSKQIFVYGVGNSNLFAEYLANHLRKIGLYASSSTNSHASYTTVANFCSQDLVIIVSETGMTREIVKLAKISRKRNVPIIAITRATNNTLSQLANEVLTTYNDLSNSSLNAMTIRCSQLYIIDMLVLNIIKGNYKKYRSFIKESENLLDEDYFGK